MRRLAVVSVFSFFGAVAQCAPATTSLPTFWRYAHPEAKALIGVEWSRMVNSPFGERIRNEMKKTGVSMKDGLEFLDDIERILISSPGNKSGGANGQPPAVIAAQGRFDLDRLREVAKADGALSVSYRSVELLIPKERPASRMALALVNPQTILLGDRKSVEAAIDLHAAADPSLSATPLYRRAAELAATNDLWVVAMTSPADFSTGNMAQSQLLNDVKSVEAGLSFRSGFGLQLNLGTKSEESARTLANGLQMMLALAVSGQDAQPGLAQLANKLQIAAESSQVKVALSISQGELEKGIGELRAAMTSPRKGSVDVRGAARGSSTWPPAQTAPREPAGPPAKKVIRIYGLEDGPREIDFSK
jgi:hypothetical protein